MRVSEGERENADRAEGWLGKISDISPPLFLSVCLYLMCYWEVVCIQFCQITVTQQSAGSGSLPAEIVPCRNPVITLS